nr:hypothetical protein [Tanacetum cinerariifolium]
MATTIEQQVAMDEALVPSTQRLRIGRINLQLPSDIQSKESTLQLVYDVLRRCPFFKAFLVTANMPEIYMQEFWATTYVHQQSIRFKMNNKKHIVNLDSFRAMLHISPRIPGQPFDKLPFEEEILEVIRNIDYAFLIWEDFVYQVEHKNHKKSNEMYYPRFTKYGAMLPLELTNDKIRNTKAYKEYYAFATEEAVPKPKDSARRKMSDSDTFITHPTATPTPKPTVAITQRLTATAKGKQTAKNEGTGFKPGILDVPTDESKEELLWNSSDDEGVDDQVKDGDDDEGDEGDKSDEEKRMLMKAKMVMKEMMMKKIRRLQRMMNRMILREGRGLQATLEVEDTHVTLTPINYDGQQESSLVSSQFMTSMLNPTSDVGNKSIQRSDQQRNLYKALVDAYEADKTILDSYGETVILKRRRDDDDQDEGPSAGSDRGSKRRREGKEPESASDLLETVTRSAGRSTTGSKSRQVSANESAFAEGTVQTTSQMDEPSYSVFETGADDQPIVNPLTVQGSTQTWISKLAKQADSRSSFNELLDNPLDFSNFIMNQLIVDTLTPELLAGPTYELMKGSYTSLIELEYHLEEVYKATMNQLDWVNPKGQRYPHNLLQPLSLIPDNRDWISLRRDDDKIYKFKDGDFKRLRLQDIEDMLLLLVQGKRSNLTVKERFAFNVSFRMFTKSIVIQRRMEDLQLGVESYHKRLNLTKPDTLMRIDELHKFSDETLNDVCTALDDRLKGIKMQYLPQTIWRKGDKDRVAAMIQSIDKMLKTRRIIRSLEKFVGGRLYEGDFRMLQRTI